MKKKFHSICKENHLGMTSILNSMIKNFIDKNQKNHKVKPDNHSILEFYSSDLEDFWMMIESTLSKKDLEELLRGAKATSGTIFINVSGSDAGSLQQSLPAVLRKNRQSVVIVLKDHWPARTLKSHALVFTNLPWTQLDQVK